MSKKIDGFNETYQTHANGATDEMRSLVKTCWLCVAQRATYV